MAAALFIASIAAALGIAAEGDRLSPPRRKWALALPVLLLAAALAATGSALVVQKWLGQLMMPVGLLWLALLAGAVLLFRQKQRRWGVAALALFVAYTLAGNEVLGAKLVGSLENDHPPVPPPPAEPYDAIFVLGGGTGETPDQEPQVNESGDRVVLAARLFHEGYARRLVATGSAIAGLSSPEVRDLAGETRAIWIDLAIDPDAIVTVREARNTSEEMAVIAALCRERGWSRIGLVTSAWHMPRAMALARTHDLAPVPLPADYRGGRTMLSIVYVLPTGHGFEQVQRAAWERLGRLVGR